LARQVHHQRYLLQPSALEVFMADRSNALLNLPTPEVRAPRPRPGGLLVSLQCLAVLLCFAGL
jgi:hypothetical protein